MLVNDLLEDTSVATILLPLKELFSMEKMFVAS